MQKESYWSSEMSATAPTIADDETLVHRAFYGKATLLLLGVLFVFIPPFLLGVLLIAYIIWSNHHSGVMVTNRRLVVFDYLWPGKTRVQEIALHHIAKVSLEPLIRPGDVHFKVIDRLLGSGNVWVQWNSRAGTHTYVLDAIIKPKELVKAVEAARLKYDPLKLGEQQGQTSN